MAWVRRLALATAVASYLLVVLGGILRVTGFTPTCTGWPLCQGRLFFPTDLTTLTEYAFRLVAVVVGVLGAATALAVWRARTGDRLVRISAGALVLVLVTQVVLGGIVGRRATQAIGLADLGSAMTLLGVALILATAAFHPATGQSELRGGRTRRRARRRSQLALGTALATALATYVLFLTDGTVAARSLPDACGRAGADCSAALISYGSTLAGHLGLIHWIVGASGLLLGVTFWQTYRERRSQPLLVQVALLSGVLFTAQIAVGAAYLLTGFPAGLAGLHLALATMAWASLVVFTVLVIRMPVMAAAATATPAVARGTASVAGLLSRLLRDYIALTKPRIISLLLATTLGAMLVAAEGIPAWGLIFWTMVGGYLAAGGANAINMYFDRDIDSIMTRTRKRPVPSQRLAPRQALIFGSVLGALSFVVYAVFVNVLSGLLALAGLLFYVLIYTRWLKRYSPQNIVIGGAAGAFPPLVGWAAVTNSVSLVAVWLFIIIFYWTPPHFWALALMRRSDYANAGVPMLPVVYGEAETRRQILLYSLVMLAVTLVLVPFRMMGPLYLVSALSLGAIWMVYTLRLWRNESPNAAWGLYKYSLLYLALLFAAMAADRTILGS